jgi:hypothetical protein
MDRHFSIPKIINNESLDEWSQHLIYQGVPICVICEYLSQQSDGRAAEYRVRLASQLPRIMLDRNLKGKALEKKGKIEEAVMSYEANVTDRCPDMYPYDRLRIIYTNKSFYAEAIRICHAYVDIANSLLNAGTARHDVLQKRDRFMNYIERLEQAKNRRTSV